MRTSPSADRMIPSVSAWSSAIQVGFGGGSGGEVDDLVEAAIDGSKEDGGFFEGFVDMVIQACRAGVYLVSEYLVCDGTQVET